MMAEQKVLTTVITRIKDKAPKSDDEDDIIIEGRFNRYDEEFEEGAEEVVNYDEYEQPPPELLEQLVLSDSEILWPDDYDEVPVRVINNDQVGNTVCDVDARIENDETEKFEPEMPKTALEPPKCAVKREASSPMERFDDKKPRSTSPVLVEPDTSDDEVECITLD